MQQLGFKLLNDISWVKPNPPPNLSCRYFTHATETIIWAAKDKKSRHTFNYKLMKATNRGKQMKSVWEIKPPETWEKKFGKHPTQKPVALLERILLASTNEGDTVLDPFAGGGTTLLTAFRLSRRAIGCELSLDYINLSIRRLCSNLVQIDLSVASVQFSVDPPLVSVDRSCSGRPLGRSASAQTSAVILSEAKNPVSAHTIGTHSIRDGANFHRMPLPFHRPPRPPRNLLRPSRLSRRRPPKIPRLRPPRLRRPLHHQNRNANLPRLNLALFKPQLEWYEPRPYSYMARCL
jgi:DNA methylase